MKKTLQQHTDEVMDYFDFDRVHKVMKHLKWTWCDSLDSPTIPELRKHVRDQMKKVYDEKMYRVECGGFAVTYHQGVEDGIEWDRFEVAFIASSWDTNDE
jgi:hypothetical protein